MPARQKGARALARGLASPESVCFSCQRSILRRQYATATAQAVALAEEPTQLSDEPIRQAADTPMARPKYEMHAAVVVSRPPVITRDLHPFENAFYFYQKRLNERTAMPFSRYFYYKKGTPADVEWKRKVKERTTPARDIGKYNPYREDGWNDELLVGAEESSPRWAVQKLLEDAEDTGTGEETKALAGDESASNKKTAVVRPMSRTTEADIKGDETSLDRALQRTLYLLVKNDKGHWSFPHALISGREELYTAAERVLIESAGPDMNTWVVGRQPIGHYAVDYPQPVIDPKDQTVGLGKKVFFMKGRIMAGQADLTSASLGFKEFKWLTKEEVQKLVTRRYWSYTEGMLAER